MALSAVNSSDVLVNNTDVENATVETFIPDTRNEALAHVEISILAIILVVALASNLFMLVALWKLLVYRPLSRMYFFMLHLSLADLMVAIFNILPQLMWDITYRFQAGDVMCRAVKYMQVMVLYLSTYILMFMAVDRYSAVCCAGGETHWNSLKVARGLVASAWTASILFAIPQAVIFTKEEIRPGIYDCWVSFVHPWGAKAYVTWFVVSIFVIPLLVITVCYVLLSYKIWIYSSRSDVFKSQSGCTCSILALRRCFCPRKRREQLEESLSSESGDLVPMRFVTGAKRTGPRKVKNQITRAKLKTIRLTLVVVVCFFVCWAPFCISQLLMVYDPPSSETQVGPVMTVLLLLASLNSCTNPWIYLVFSGTLLNQLRVCFGLGTSQSRDNCSIGDDQADKPEAKPRHDKKHDVHPSNKIISTKSDVV